MALAVVLDPAWAARTPTLSPDVERYRYAHPSQPLQSTPSAAAAGRGAESDAGGSGGALECSALPMLAYVPAGEPARLQLPVALASLRGSKCTPFCCTRS